MRYFTTEARSPRSRKRCDEPRVTTVRRLTPTRPGQFLRELRVSVASRDRAIIKSWTLDRGLPKDSGRDGIGANACKPVKLLLPAKHEKEETEIETGAVQRHRSIEEKAFYDILKEIAHKYKFEYPEDKLIILSQAVKKVVDDKAKYTDWSHRDDIKAELKMDLILLLAEHGYPPVPKDEVFKEIFEQAENFKKYMKE